MRLLMVPDTFGLCVLPSIENEAVGSIQGVQRIIDGNQTGDKFKVLRSDNGRISTVSSKRSGIERTRIHPSKMELRNA